MIDNKYINEMKGINIYISKDSKVSDKAKILCNSIILGKSEIKDDAIIGPNSIIIDSIVQIGAEIFNSVVANSNIGSKTTIGPFAHLRDNVSVGSECRIGNFVEIKKSRIGDKSKLSHLAYVGDSQIGVNCNFGCGSITVNYDGVNKHKTTIGDNVFIGCNTNLVAPVTIHNNSFIACGSTITVDVPEKTLAIARSRQLNKIDYYK